MSNTANGIFKRLTIILTILVIFALSASACSKQEYFPAPDPIPEPESVFRKEQTRFIAHRGLSGQYPDNTIESFEAAGQSDFFWGIETDIWLINGTFYLSHDYPQDIIGLPTLPEYLYVCNLYEKAAVIDIKSTLTTDNARFLLETTEDYEVMFISLVQSNLQALRQEGFNGKMQLIYVLPTNITYDYDVNFYSLFLTQSLYTQARENKVEIGVWTITDKVKAQQAVDTGVDYITTDYIFE
jgi:glycerophosphoryl diester phosphodiesterase